MGERRRAPKILAAATVVALGIAGCGGSGEGGATPANTSAGSATASPSGSPERSPSSSPTTGREFPWPHCDNAPEHRPPAVGSSKDGPVVLVDSHCTEPSDPYTGVYDASGPASQKEGIPAGRMRNGSKVVDLCWLTGDEKINNDSGVGVTRWDRVIPVPGQEMLDPNGVPITTTGSETFVIPNTHLAFFSDPAVQPCPPA